MSSRVSFLLPSGKPERGMAIMSATMTGAEFKRFYSDGAVWAEGSYHEDVSIFVDGIDASEAEIDLSGVADSAQVKVNSGEIMDAPPGVPTDLVDAVAWWRARQVSVECVVTVPKAKMEAFEAAMAALDLAGAVIRLG